MHICFDLAGGVCLDFMFEIPQEQSTKKKEKKVKINESDNESTTPEFFF